MSEHPIVTQLAAEQLAGYAAAMEEAAERARDPADQDWLTDRAAIARGLMAREGWHSRYWRDGLHPADGAGNLVDALCVSADADMLRPVAMRSNCWPGIRWAVWLPGEDIEIEVLDTEAAAQTLCDTWVTAEEALEVPLREADDGAPGDVEAIAAGLGIPASTMQADIAAAQSAAPLPAAEPPAEAAEALPKPSRTRKWHQLDAAEQTEVQRLFEAGQTAPAISAQVGVLPHAIYYQANKQGWRFKCPPAVPPSEEDLAEARINMDRGAKWIAEEYGWELATAQRLVAGWRAEDARPIPVGE